MARPNNRRKATSERNFGMSEIEKMYMRCKIKKQQTCSHSDTCYNGSLDECEGCNAYQYPPFTAEKQIELIKWLGKLDGKLEITCTYNKEKFIFYFYFNRKTDKNPDPKYPYSNFLNEDIEILIASLINSLWQDLTEEEKQQVKGILE